MFYVRTARPERCLGRRPRRDVASRSARADHLSSPRADRLRRAVHLLRCPDDARQRAERAAGVTPLGSRPDGRGGLQRACRHRRASRLMADLRPPVSLADLLRQLAEQPGDLLFRISSLEPMDFTPAVERQLLSSPRFAPHFHLPLQHASDRILRAMGRPYALAAYERLVSRLRRRLPDAAIGADVIVGFPGETEADFRTTADYLLGSPLTYLHVFAYSDRPGTAAAGFRSRVPSAEIRARTRELRGVARQLAGRFQRTQVNGERRGLTLADGSMVLTDNYLKVRVPPGQRRNEWVRVRILADGDPMTGVVTGRIARPTRRRWPLPGAEPATGAALRRSAARRRRGCRVPGSCEPTPSGRGRPGLGEVRRRARPTGRGTGLPAASLSGMRFDLGPSRSTASARAAARPRACRSPSRAARTRT